MTQAPKATGSAVKVRVSAVPWRALGADPREVTATQRARRLAVLLMALSSLLTIAVLAAAWVLLRNIF